MTHVVHGELVDPRAARCAELAQTAVGSQRTSTKAWLELGAELLEERSARPDNQGFGEWLKRYNYFGTRREYLWHAMEAREYVVVIGITTDEVADVPLQRLSRMARDEKARRKREELPPAPSNPMFDLRLGDFREVLADVTGADAIITDPPYPAEYLPLLDDLAAFADRALKPDGVMAVLMGQTHLPEVYRRLCAGPRPYRWTAAYTTPGNGYVSMARRVQSNWKPLLIFGGGRRFADVFASEDVRSRHEWGQDYAAFAEIVERLTEPGAVVVDPFAGHGTTLFAATRAGRHAIGAEIDPQHHAQALARA